MRQGNFTIYLLDYNLFDIHYNFTGKIKYVKYVNRLEILVEIAHIEPYVFFKPKPIYQWINSDKIKIHFNPLPISETIVECGK